MSKTKAPLWKQLIGACAGAAAAFVLYQGYTTASDHLTAYLNPPLVTDAAGHVYPSGTLDSPALAVASSSSEQSSAASSSSSSTAGVFGSWPYGWVRRFRLFTTASSASSVSSQSAVVARAPSFADLVTGPASSSSSSVPSSPFMRRHTVGTLALADAPLAGANAAGMSSSSTEGVTANEAAGIQDNNQVAAPQVMPDDPAQGAAMAEQASSSEDTIPPMPAPEEPVVTAAIMHTNGKLPQSGFGLDVLAVTAIGAAIGRRKARAKKA